MAHVLEFCLFAFFALAVPALAADFSAKVGENEIVVHLDGEVFTAYKHAPDLKKPYLYPVAGPVSGETLTIESHPTQYPHHNSLWFGCDRVNGGNYWQDANERGQILSQGPRVVEGGPKRVVIEDECLWRQPGQDPVMRDYRRITIAAPSTDQRVIDFDITLVPLADITIEKTNHALFSARMVPELSVLSGGTLVNAHRDTQEAGTFGKPSPWADYSGTRGGVTEGLAILEHPKNRWAPSPWFTRDYGFFSPTAMYWPEGDATHIAQGERVTLRYRVIAHAGDATSAAIAEQNSKYVAEPLSEAPGNAALPQDAGRKPNLLFIAVDDLRPELGCYGNEVVHSPNLDRLASEGRLFLDHYVQVPTCGASRYAMLTSRRPSSAASLSNDAARQFTSKETPEPQSFPELFRRNGYTTVCIGKISHQPDGRVYTYEGDGDGHVEVPFAWSELATPYGQWDYGHGAFFGYANGVGRTFHPRPTPFENADVPDTGYPDGLIAEAAIEKLRELKSTPFLLAVGFYKPHLPFNSPRKYWDLYEEKEIPLSPNPEKPAGIDPRSWHESGEMFRYAHPDGRNVTEEHARNLRRAYYACISYVDAQIGKVLDALDQLGLAENTVVVVWGDHGWHLGDHGIWGKHTTFERALKSTLIVRLPGMNAPGVPAAGMVEAIDLYPTLAELCGLEPPEGLDGESMRPILEDPRHPGKEAAFGYWKGRKTMRTDRWRLVRYDAESPGEPVVELFDHKSDPLETTNVAADHPEVVAALVKRLEAAHAGR